MGKKTITTEKFDKDGKLIERITVEDADDPVIIPSPLPSPYNPYPNPLPQPYIGPYYSPNVCSACANSGVCNCVIGPGTTITCEVA